jgi:type 2 lantibiotic biosynthesis protein LanM
LRRQIEMSAEFIFRASTLYERLKWPGVFADDSPEPHRIDDRLRTWCEHSAAGDQDRFAKRLAQLGHTVVTIRPYLGSKPPASAASSGGEIKMPSWAALLRELFDWLSGPSSQSTSEGSTSEFLDETQPVAFEHFLAPLVEFSRVRLAGQHGLGLQLLSMKAQQLFCRHLLIDLSYAASGPLFLEFSVFRLRGGSAASGHSNNSSVPEGESRGINKDYLRFCQGMLQERLGYFLGEYSFLWRRLATFMEFWLEVTGEFLLRLAADLPALGSLFNDGRHPGKVNDVKLGVSDRHNRGRSVIVVQFEDGLRVVYKPKDIGLERAFFDFVHSSAAGDELELKTLRNLVRPGYGWAEYVDDKPCEDPSQIPRFFQRAGRLMGLLYGLNGTDFHGENVIASGEHPVPVDLETLLNPDFGSPDMPTPDENETQKTARQRSISREPLFTVLNCGLLPSWTMGPKNQLFDQSGFGGFRDPHAVLQCCEFRPVNTDEMKFAFKPFELGKPKNLPHIDGVEASSDDHVDAILGGFEEGYRFCLSVRSGKQGGEDGRARFRNLRARHVFRHTRIYASLLGRTNRVECQREGVDASLVWDGMSRAFRDLKPDDPWLAVLEAEHRAMACDDVPVFYTNTSSKTLIIPQAPPLPNHFRRSGWNTLKRHLQGMDAEDLRRQSELIRQSFYARQAGSLDSWNHVQPIVELGEPAEFREVDESLLRKIPSAIAEQIISSAFPDGAGNLFWSGLSPDAAINRFTAGILGGEFYQGQGGIAFFLAAMERAFPGQGCASAAEGALRLLRQDLRASGRLQVTSEKISLGGMSGLGSLVYSLLRTGLLLGREDFVDDAEKLAGFISESSIEADTDLDVMAGSAGVILTLLALHRHTCSEVSLDKAVSCGRHLLRCRIPSATGLRAWPTLKGRLLTGFSHGAAGISFALFKLFEQAGLPEFHEAAREGVEYERHSFVPDQSNWPDLRNANRDPTFPNQWCHGATGIGYSRLGMMAAGPVSGVEKEIETAVELTLDQSLSRVDHLCCGNAGQISFLFDAARQMQRPDWEAAARARLGRLLALRNQGNSFRLFFTLPGHVFHPGFMQGAAGIGYALLRLARPDLSLPCCLLLE